MKNFPFRSNRITYKSFFISHCKDFGIKINERLLEFFHQKGILVPIARLNPGVAEARKVTSKKTPGKHGFVDVHDLEQMQKKDGVTLVDDHIYYAVGSSSLGTGIDGGYMIDYYIKKELIDYPVDDEKFIPWAVYKYPNKEFAIERKNFEKYRQLLYSKDQIYILHWILKWRPYKIEFNYPPSDKLMEDVKKKAKRWVESFDEIALSKGLEQRYVYFDLYYAIYDFLTDFYKELHLKFNKNLKDEESLSDKELKAEFNAAKENLVATKYQKKAEKFINKYDQKCIEEVRDFFLHAGFENHEDMKTYKLNEFRMKHLRKNKKTAFLVDALERIKVVEELYKISGIKDWISIEKIYGFSDNMYHCEICGNIFFRTDGRQKNKQACSPECSEKLKKRNRKPKRRKQKAKK
ncbi:hypothetical protein HOD30_00480 [Candidatus Peregrinibacteria bacterium]|jgi:hypothetical protein|nr:hypothetical protein [Candidatus Peregrinibacteria bacterium]MBT4631981.1 hypothetical protein [Candidatus Peregrinibacteria bacterium]MBT5823816.1 hypothetical protein [Candidatus Peregrinibacteria bacterium]